MYNDVKINMKMYTTLTNIRLFHFKRSSLVMDKILIIYARSAKQPMLAHRHESYKIVVVRFFRCEAFP